MVIDAGLAAVLVIAIVVIGTLRFQRNAGRVQELEREVVKNRILRHRYDVVSSTLGQVETHVKTALEIAPDANLAVIKGIIDNGAKELSQ